MKATDSKGQQAKLFFLKAAKHVPLELLFLLLKQVQQQSRSARLTRLHPTIDMSSDSSLDG
jgi:hypothetical protein